MTTPLTTPRPRAPTGRGHRRSQASGNRSADPKGQPTGDTATGHRATHALIFTAQPGSQTTPFQAQLQPGQCALVPGIYRTGLSATGPTGSLMELACHTCRHPTAGANSRHESPLDDTTHGATAKALRYERIRANEALRQRRSALSTIDKLRQQLNEANRRADQAEADLTNIPHAGDLQAENARLRQRIKQKEKKTRPTPPSTILPSMLKLNDVHPFVVRNVTVLNHAINLCRNPLRQFVLKRLRAAYGSDLSEPLARAVDFKDDRARQRSRQDPAAVIDISDLVSIVQLHPEQFRATPELENDLRRLRLIRNAAAHPEPSGIDDRFTLESLQRIATTLKRIGHDDSPVNDLTALLHQQPA